MSQLLETIEVPKKLKVNEKYTPSTIEIYQDKVVANFSKGTSKIWEFAFYTGIDMQIASLACGIATINFIPDGKPTKFVNGDAIFSQPNRILFCEGAFSYKGANEYCTQLKEKIEKAYYSFVGDMASNKPDTQSTANNEMDNIKALKEYKALLDDGILTQEEFDKKKAELLSSKVTPVAANTGLKSIQIKTIDADKTKTIKAIRTIDNSLSLTDAQAIVEQQNPIFKENLDNETANEYCSKLNAMGVQAVIINADGKVVKPLGNDDVVRCPNCGSKEVNSGHRGWSLVWGLLGSSKVVLTCLKCGHKWKPEK